MDLLKKVQAEASIHPYKDTKDLLLALSQNMMRNELLTITMEECSEVAVECSKVIRFAATDSSFSPTLEREIGDLMCMVDLLKEANIVTNEGIDEAKSAKREKLKKWSDLNV